MTYMCICTFKHPLSHELVINSNSNSNCTTNSSHPPKSVVHPRRRRQGQQQEAEEWQRKPSRRRRPGPDPRHRHRRRHRVLHGLPGPVHPVPDDGLRHRRHLHRRRHRRSRGPLILRGSHGGLRHIPRPVEKGGDLNFVCFIFRVCFVEKFIYFLKNPSFGCAMHGKHHVIIYFP